MVDALLYSSHATDSLTDAELEVILARSRAVNAVRGITGALIKRGDRIVQYLEGEPTALERTYAAIAGSAHHDDVRVEARAHGVQRQFDAWHMGFAEFQPRHNRGAATEGWTRVLDGARAAGAANPPLARLIEYWDAFADG